MATTGRHPLIQLESVYLTKTGLVGGIPCKMRVEGLGALAVTDDHGVDKALSGLPYLQIVDSMLGKPIGLFAEENMTEAVYDSIVTEIQAVLDGSKTELDLEISDSPYGSFSLDVVPDVNPVRHNSEQWAGYVKGVSFHFLTTTI